MTEEEEVFEHGTNEEYREAAREEYVYGSHYGDGAIEIDEDAIVSREHDHTDDGACFAPGSNDEPGAFVAAWIWVEKPAV